MRLFISHAAEDLEIAKVLRLRLNELSPRFQCFLLMDDIFAAEDWEHAIRRAAQVCDGLVSLVTPAYIDRPWFYAEWAVFWFQEKPWYLLLDNVAIERVIEPMRRRQLIELRNRRSIEHFLRTLIGDETLTPLDLLAAEIAKSVQTALVRQARSNAEAHLARLSSLFQHGGGILDQAIVEQLYMSGHLQQAMALAFESNNSVVLRQFGIVLVNLGLIAEAGAVAQQVANRSERRTVASHALRMLAQEAKPELLDLVLAIYGTVGDPQRRDLRDVASRLELNIDWPTACAPRSGNQTDMT